MGRRTRLRRSRRALAAMRRKKATASLRLHSGTVTPAPAFPRTTGCGTWDARVARLPRVCTSFVRLGLSTRCPRCSKSSFSAGRRSAIPHRRSRGHPPGAAFRGCSARATQRSACLCATGASDAAQRTDSRLSASLRSPGTSGVARQPGCAGFRPRLCSSRCSSQAAALGRSLPSVVPLQRRRAAPPSRPPAPLPLRAPPPWHAIPPIPPTMMRCVAQLHECIESGLRAAGDRARSQATGPPSGGARRRASPTTPRA